MKMRYLAGFIFPVIIVFFLLFAFLPKNILASDSDIVSFDVSAATTTATVHDFISDSDVGDSIDFSISTPSGQIFSDTIFATTTGDFYYTWQYPTSTPTLTGTVDYTFSTDIASSSTIIKSKTITKTISTSIVGFPGYGNSVQGTSEETISSFNNFVQTLGTNLSGALSRIDIETSNPAYGYYGTTPILTLYECDTAAYGDSSFNGTGCTEIYSGFATSGSGQFASIQSFYPDSYITLNQAKYYFFTVRGNNQFNSLPVYYGSGADTVSGTCYQNNLGVIRPCTNISDLSFRLYGISQVTPPSVLSGNDNVLFLPGVEATRLYGLDTPCDAGVCDTKLWEPDGDALVSRLENNPDGTSINKDIYASDVIDTAYVPIKGNIYKSFMNQMDGLKTNGTINDWEAVPYDWRLSPEQILTSGAVIGQNKISYLVPTSTPYIIQELHRLASSSQTGKVTIVAHSYGGIIAKKLIEMLGADAPALIDKVIFVAVPQVGTPKAVGSLLHGFDQGINVIIKDKLSESAARTLAQNVSGTYEFLPSAQYFTQVNTPVVTFDSSPALATFRDRYDSEIRSESGLYDFVTDSRRLASSTPNDLLYPAVGNSGLFGQAEIFHGDIDNWQPPAGMNLYEIAGWGEDTVETIEYYSGQKSICDYALGFVLVDTCREAPMMLYKPVFTVDGDGTVATPSAMWIPESSSVQRYWVNLKNFNTNPFLIRKHADIFEVDQLRSLIQNIIIATSTDSLPQYISTSTPIDTDISDTRLNFDLHSPLTLDVYDDAGNHTGISTTTGEVEENVPGSRYEIFGEVQHISIPTSTHIHLTMHGTDTGSFTLDIAEVSAGNIIASTTFSGIPSSTNTVVTLEVPQNGGIASASSLQVDENGDGKNIITLTPVMNGVQIYTPPEPVTSTTVLISTPTIPTGNGPIIQNAITIATTSTQIVSTTTASMTSAAPLSTSILKPHIIQAKIKKVSPATFTEGSKINQNTTQTAQVISSGNKYLSGFANILIGLVKRTVDWSLYIFR